MSFIPNVSTVMEKNYHLNCMFDIIFENKVIMVWKCLFVDSLSTDPEIIRR